MKTLKALVLTLTFAPVALTVAQAANDNVANSGRSTDATGTTGMTGVGLGTTDTTTNASPTGISASAYGQDTARRARTGMMGQGTDANAFGQDRAAAARADRTNTGTDMTGDSTYGRMHAGAHMGTDARSTGITNRNV